MTSPHSAATRAEAQQAVDSATMWLTEAVTTARRRRARMLQSEAELNAAREALLLAQLVLQHIEGQPSAEVGTEPPA